jgi:hypothetical protein
MAGLDPAIHVFISQQRKEDSDARDKAGHDDSAGAKTSPLLPPATMPRRTAG